MIALFDILEMIQISLQLILGRENCTVNSLQHLTVLIASPVCSGGGDQLKMLDLLQIHQMRAGAQVGKSRLLIEGNDGIFRQILNQFDLIRFIRLFHLRDRFRARQGVTRESRALLDDRLHLLFDRTQIFIGKRRVIEIIIESVFDRRADRHLRIREETEHCLRHDMRGRMAQCRETFRISGRQDLKLAVPGQRGSKITDLAIDLADSRIARKALTDILCHFKDRNARCILAYAPVFK